MDDGVANEPMPDEDARRVPARPDDPERIAREPRSRTHPGGGRGAATAGGGTGEVPEGGATGPGPAVAEPPSS
jgi:hypothetical protein